MDIFLYQYPLTVVLAVGFMLLTWIVFRFAGSTLVRVLGSWKAGALCMTAMVPFVVAEGTWRTEWHHSIPFVMIVMAFLLCLGLSIMTRLQGGLRHHPHARRFVITHLGVYLMIGSSFWGAPDVVEATISVSAEKEYRIASCHDRAMILPFSLLLDEFTIDMYEDGVNPRQYTSLLTVRDTTSGAMPVKVTTSVNHPGSYKGYKMYQASYDRAEEAGSVITIVRDPWMPLVYLGMMMLLVGIALTFSAHWKLKVLLPSILILTVVFTVASLARINFSVLKPTLNSIWFVPHVMIYMVAYSAMAVSVVLAIVDCLKRGKEAGIGSKAGAWSESLIRVSSVLLFAGMICGCFWAERAWGRYWGWDPKECWAAVTWLLTLTYIHLAPLKAKHDRMLLALMLSAFLAIQITWYGVYYLPSNKSSIHSYASEQPYLEAYPATNK